MDMEFGLGMMRRRPSYKASSGMLGAEESRRRREDNMVQIRRARREHILAAKRRRLLNTTTATPSQSPLSNPNSNLSECLPRMVEGVWSSDPVLQLEAMIEFRKLLASDLYPPIEEVVKAGVVPCFADFLLKQDLPQIQYEAAWIMTNISFGTSEHIQVAVENGVVPKLVQLLSSSNADIQEQAVWALGNIVGDSPRFRDLVLMHSGLLPILSRINECSTLSMIRIATWVLSNFFRGKPPAPFEQVKPALPVLKQLTLCNDAEVLKDVCWALCNFSSGSSGNIKALCDIGICPRLIEILHHHSSSTVIMPALTTVGNIAGCDDPLTQLLIDNGVLSCLLQMISEDHKSKIKKEACWTISSITATNEDNIQAVIDANIIQPLVQLLNYAEYDVKVDAAWAISNALCYGCSDQIRILASRACIEPLCNLLSCSDTRTVLACLKGLERILNVGEADKTSGESIGVNVYALYMYQSGCLEKIEDLQEHGNNDIYKKAITIIENYWDDLEDR